MKTLIKVNNLELVSSRHGLTLLESGVTIANFLGDQLLSAVIALVSQAGQNNRKISSTKLMANFQPQLF